MGTALFRVLVTKHAPIHVPVSYTHLDVYKRQAIKDAPLTNVKSPKYARRGPTYAGEYDQPSAESAQARPQPAPRFACPPQRTSCPVVFAHESVSYTHLDVYKRQDQCNVILLKREDMQ